MYTIPSSLLQPNIPKSDNHNMTDTISPLCGFSVVNKMRKLLNLCECEASIYSGLVLDYNPWLTQSQLSEHGSSVFILYIWYQTDIQVRNLCFMWQCSMALGIIVWRRHSLPCSITYYFFRLYTDHNQFQYLFLQMVAYNIDCSILWPLICIVKVLVSHNFDWPMHMKN